MRSCQAERLAAETVEEIEVRLQQMRDRLAGNSAEEIEMRLQQMSRSQRERLAAENAEEREVRLQHDRESHRERRVQETLGDQLHLPLIQQRAVQAMMHVHNNMEVSPTYRIICLPLLTWNDMVLGTLAHLICDQCFLYVHVWPSGLMTISDHNLRSCCCIMRVYCVLAQARPTMPCICLLKII